MKAQSNINPESIIKCKEKTIINFNIVESIVEDIDGNSTTVFNFDYVEIGDVTRDKLISAMIQDKYPTDAEIALLNNKIAGKDLTEYDEYQNFREAIKSTVDAIPWNI